MKFDNNILNELQTLSPLLAGIPRNNVFIVPRGYFETISETILLCIKEETGAINNSATVDVPKGYFDNLSATILDKIKAQQENNSTEEIKALSPLLHSLQQTNVFEVPQEYFESLDSAVADKIKVQQDAVAAEEIKVLSPLLHSLKQTNVFEVPTGYFTSLPAKVLHAVNATTTAKVVRIPKLRLIVKYAAAAAITGLMVLGVYKYADKPAKSAPAVSFAKPYTSI
jgi:adenylate kinase